MMDTPKRAVNDFEKWGSAARIRFSTLEETLSFCRKNPLVPVVIDGTHGDFETQPPSVAMAVIERGTKGLHGPVVYVDTRLRDTKAQERNKYVDAGGTYLITADDCAARDFPEDETSKKEAVNGLITRIVRNAYFRSMSMNLGETTRTVFGMRVLLDRTRNKIMIGETKLNIGESARLYTILEQFFISQEKDGGLFVSKETLIQTLIMLGMKYSDNNLNVAIVKIRKIIAVPPLHFSIHATPGIGYTLTRNQEHDSMHRTHARVRGASQEFEEVVIRREF